MDVYNLPDSSDATYALKRRFLTWYANVWLVKCAGYEHYGPTVRPFKLAVSAKSLHGVKVPIVAMESEAFGRLMYENCLVKWQHILAEKYKDDKWQIPLYDKDNAETHKYHQTKYSDKNTGQVKGAGWSPAAYDALTKHIQEVKAFRKEDKLKGYPIHKLCKDLIREEMKVTEEKYSLKRRRGVKGRLPTPVYNDVVELSDKFSEGTDGSDED
jgi:hypothetical protein